MNKLDEIASRYNSIKDKRIVLLSHIESDKRLAERYWRTMDQLNNEYVEEQTKQTNVEGILKLCRTGR